MKSKSLWVDNQPLSIFGGEVGAFYYEERALLMTEPKDIVIIDYEIDNEYLCQLRKIPKYKFVYLIFLKVRHYDLVESILKWEKIDWLIQLENEVFHIYICKTFNPHNSYSGFCYPCEIDVLNELKKNAENMLTVLTEKYKKDMDCFGIDFIISEGEIFYHDLNARKTAVTYVLSFLKKINHNFDTCKSFKTICLYFRIKKKILYSNLFRDN